MSDSEQLEEPVTTRVSQKGQTTIPKEIRDRLGIEPGDRVEWTDDGGEITINKQIPESSRGALRPEDMTDEEAEEWAQQMEDYVREKRRTEWNGDATPSEEQ
ncbi:AbrB/MazE/SpoVT family DNA-binding domain-containing protein [Halobaculum sp. MBLA0147]|uniref:AbrB/MazE/SpoVT family DNA-binding domain-containing protein n=1 Tax=Halobaculum sp. MBLA0147 TaxID=3079934 RepID=UPI0035262176